MNSGSASSGSPTIEFTVNGVRASVADDGCSLLEVLRDRIGIRSVKDGCSPQGQCGCCTVLIDGAARVACVTPARRVAGRAVTTIEGLDDAEEWAESFYTTGASQCGFCTPGIVVRLAALGNDRNDPAAVENALLAHLCRCTGWRSILDAAGGGVLSSATSAPRDTDRGARRAAVEGHVEQVVMPSVALGQGGFAADTAPADSLIALRRADGEWVVADTLTEARGLAGKVQGRRSTAPVVWPVDVPAGEWARTLRTTWVEPAYLEPDAAWCLPGGAPATPLANGGAFGGKSTSPVGAVARRLADDHGRPVLAMMTREDTVRLGPKRPPVAVAVDEGGTGVMRIARPAWTDQADALRRAIAHVAPRLDVELVDVVGPTVSTALRASGWAEAAVVTSSLGGAPDRVVSPDGALATATIDRAEDGSEVVSVAVRCGDPLDEIVLRSYCIGAAHMALGWVRSESLAVDDDGIPLDLTIRSFGILRAVDTPAIDVRIEPSDQPPVNGSDAVFAAVAAAAWRAEGFLAGWPAKAARDAR
jgi:aerobic-type carbon monoxide dehydrogenase small subunit (CoxS/CutS family)